MLWAIVTLCVVLFIFMLALLGIKHGSVWFVVVFSFILAGFEYMQWPGQDVFYVLFIISVCYSSAVLLSRGLESRVEKNALLKLLDQSLVFIGLLVALFIILRYFNIQITPLIAGLGIGGLAIALATRDLLSNVFGGIVIFTDKPFGLGDRIKILHVDGFVEHIAIRTTKIRTLDGTYIYMPNAKFTDNPVENVSQERARKVTMSIGLTYDTSTAKIKEAKQMLQRIIEQQEGVDKDRIIIAFTDFGEYAKKILVIYWIVDKGNILVIRDAINMAINDAFSKKRISMAFPTQTVYMKK
ncbi:MAG: mechanosensitive ion channel family protein [Candidatus Woesearchaeota archaeon]